MTVRLLLALPVVKLLKQFADSKFLVGEDGSAISAILLVCTGGNNGVVGATVTPSNGTATSPGDYNSTQESCNFCQWGKL